MNQSLYQDSLTIIKEAIEAVKPDAAVKRAVEGMSFSGDLYLVAIGKASWQMARAALLTLDYPLKKGIVITKYGHVKGPLLEQEFPVDCYEAGHPLPDANSYRATQAVLDMTASLSASDTVLFLISGGGSALFELPLIDAKEMEGLTQAMLNCGMSIEEINIIRKRLSSVKGGKFAKHCLPAHIEAVILSDIVGDPVDMIASGPAAPDSSSSQEALRLLEKYKLPGGPAIVEALSKETPKELVNVRTQITGSVKELCQAASKAAEGLGYFPVQLGSDFTCQADALASLITNKLLEAEKEAMANDRPLAFIAGGETLVKVTGRGLGGRNQQLALAAADPLRGHHNLSLISVGSDGTDGPTDAAGGYVDGDSYDSLLSVGIIPEAYLYDNDSYHALEAIGGLIKTGPTGTNVNDLAVGLIRKTDN